mmetsp:Transcript_2571/g.3488  ORF Transcript_2571/g.3488 Transcript_2571/m.3488 type:complete len:280 (+) Transcript_2571:269-1108(+)
MWMPDVQQQHHTILLRLVPNLMVVRVVENQDFALLPFQCQLASPYPGDRFSRQNDGKMQPQPMITWTAMRPEVGARSQNGELHRAFWKVRGQILTHEHEDLSGDGKVFDQGRSFLIMVIIVVVAATILCIICKHRVHSFALIPRPILSGPPPHLGQQPAVSCENELPPRPVISNIFVVLMERGVTRGVEAAKLLLYLLRAVLQHRDQPPNIVKFWVIFESAVDVGERRRRKGASREQVTWPLLCRCPHTLRHGALIALLLRIQVSHRPVRPSKTVKYRG